MYSFYIAFWGCLDFFYFYLRFIKIFQMNWEDFPFFSQFFTMHLNCGLAGARSMRAWFLRMLCPVSARARFVWACGRDNSAENDYIIKKIVHFKPTQWYNRKGLFNYNYIIWDDTHENYKTI